MHYHQLRILHFDSQWAQEDEKKAVKQSAAEWLKKHISRLWWQYLVSFITAMISEECIEQ